MQVLTLHLETVDQTDLSYRINADTFFKFLDSRQGKDYKHYSDDIIRHGHPLHFTEDVFEKNHKSIKESIRHQNGHQSSRDTVIQFAKSELTKHVVSGGFLHLNDTWKQASSFILK